jgi:hypothetical protein
VMHDAARDALVVLHKQPVAPLRAQAAATMLSSAPHRCEKRHGGGEQHAVPGPAAAVRALLLELEPELPGDDLGSSEQLSSF